MLSVVHLKEETVELLTKNKVGNIWKEAIVSQYESHPSLRNKENNAKNLSQYGRCSVLDSNFIPPSRIHFTHRQTYESQNDQGRVVLVPAGKQIFLHSQSVQADSGFTHPNIQREGDLRLKFNPKPPEHNTLSYQRC
jgi:hypothetical protein